MTDQTRRRNALGQLTPSLLRRQAVHYRCVACGTDLRKCELTIELSHERNAEPCGPVQWSENLAYRKQRG